MFAPAVFVVFLSTIVADDSCQFFVHRDYGRTGRCIKGSECASNAGLPNLCDDRGEQFKCCFNSTLSNKGCPKVISRAGWQARPAREFTSMPTPVAFVFIHDTVTPGCLTNGTCIKRIRSIQADHMDQRGWADIGYNFLIGENGLVYEGRGWTRAGAHRSGYNQRSIGIAIIGDYKSRKAGKLVADALESLIRCGISRRHIQFQHKVLGQRHHLL